MSKHGNGKEETDYFDLDENRLDQEWLNQPRLYFQHATLLASARKELERAKAKENLVAAEVELDVRKRPEHYGIDKVTEGVVSSTVTVQARYQSAKQELLNAQHEVRVHEVDVATLDHRKKALENMVQLQMANYYSEPRAPREAGRRMNEVKSDKAFGKKKR